MSKDHADQRALFVRLFDDAAMFPPGNASAADAIAEHLRDRSAAYADLVGPLLVHVDRWGEFAAAHRHVGSPHIDVVIIGSATAEPADSSGLRVVGHEVSGQLSSLGTTSDRPVAVELASDARLDEDLAALARMRRAGAPLRAKFRTGGTSAESFPAASQVATFVCSAVDHGVPVKFTAGLHLPVRHTDATTGFEHHGFLNLATAIWAALQGAGSSEVTMVLDERRAEPLVSQVAAWTPDEIAAVRSTFTSIGCCGVTDPIADAVALGLLNKESA